jgi:hypothetical protein
MTEPTDADRAKAAELLGRVYFNRPGDRTFADDLAAALAEARAAGRAEEALAVTAAWQWKAWADMPRGSGRPSDLIGAAQYVTEWLRARADALTDERAQR